jgi:hypothetical protein
MVDDATAAFLNKRGAGLLTQDVGGQGAGGRGQGGRGRGNGRGGPESGPSLPGNSYIDVPVDFRLDWHAL